MEVVVGVEGGVPFRKKGKSCAMARCALLMFLVVGLAIGLIFGTLKKDSDQAATIVTSVASISNGSIVGTVTFMQDTQTSLVTINYNIAGLPPNASHGFHIHTSPDLGNGCINAGSHFNFYSVLHGAPSNDISNRHVGDLGNIFADLLGVASGTFTDSIISLIQTSNTSILGRAVVIHRDRDDLGLGGTPLSNTTGNAGPRIACAVINFPLT